MKQSWVRALQIVSGLSACFMLFQNFSLDNDYKDIRTIAPKGTPVEPPSPYFPEHMRATSLNALGNEMLKHNFGDEIKQFENQFEDWAGINMGSTPAAAFASGAGTNGGQEKHYRLRTGHLGKDRFGFRLQSSFNVKCEYSALKRELQLSVDKALSRNANLSLRHNADDHQSMVNFSYAW